MVNHEAQRKYENVVAAIDMSDASANAVHVALSTGLISEKARRCFMHLWRWLETEFMNPEHSTIHDDAVDDLGVKGNYEDCCGECNTPRQVI
jgi:hypothetical protein